MAIENERKIVLFGLKEEHFDDEWTRLDVTQGYLRSNRIRRAVYSTGAERYWFTAKHVFEDEVFEYEMEMPRAEFKKLITIADNIVVKTRFTKKFGYDTWDVDFFGGTEDPYFVMAEVEMRPRQVDFNQAPTIIAACDWYRVENGDKRFTSKKLSDREHAAQMLAEIQVEMSR